MHDAERLAARLVNALDIVPPEVQRHDEPKSGGEEIRRHARGEVHRFGRFIDQAAQVLAGADAADGAGEDVVEDQSGNRKAGHERTHGVAHHDIDAAAHEHAAAFHVHRAHGEAEQHDAQDEPGRAGADGLFSDSTSVEGRRREIA